MLNKFMGANFSVNRARAPRQAWPAADVAGAGWLREIAQAGPGAGEREWRRGHGVAAQRRAAARHVPAQQQEAASKQLLESLIDRQLLQSEAAKEKLDRDPKVVQSIERAKALIIAQAYLQKHVAAPAKPTPAEINEYYSKNPLFFAGRKCWKCASWCWPARI
jgi:hypothetical protein